MKKISTAMRIFLNIGLERFAWALRRLHCPVGAEALVLEVGSGGNPYPRSNVLLDAYEETRERHWAPLVSDRPTVLGFVEKLPFRDKAFDFVVASHVLEHSTDPVVFLSELQRVAKAGYIEVPDAFMERVNPYRDHRLEVTVRDGGLVIRKKMGWMAEPDTVELYEERVKPLLTRELIPKHPFAFHVRFFWEGTIPFRIVNRDTPLDWQPPAVDSPGTFAGGGGLRSMLQKCLGRMYTQASRNKQLSIAQLLSCPDCSEYHLHVSPERIHCPSCQASFPVRNGIPVMYPKEYPTA